MASRREEEEKLAHGLSVSRSCDSMFTHLPSDEFEPLRTVVALAET